MDLASIVLQTIKNVTFAIKDQQIFRKCFLTNYLEKNCLPCIKIPWFETTHKLR
jgi:hypothetical protein